MKHVTTSRVLIINKIRKAFLFISLLLCSGLYAQNITQNITLNLRNATLKEFFNRIENQTTYSVVYRDVILSEANNITLATENKPLNEVLDQVLAPKRLSYKLSNKTIVILPASPAKDNTKTNRGETLTGVIKDDAGQPIVGANIVVKGKMVGTVSGLKGEFEIEATENDILIISYIGYLTREIKIGNKTNLKISLQEDALGLDEVVVVGYGTVKKRDLTGSVASINAQKISAVPATTAAEALQGRVPGVLVTNTNWSPGQSPGVMIRGKRSITASNDPLYVVDGIPITGGLKEISPTDIESMEVLKDASATAIYGARGANGVILITTKQGQEGKTQVDYNGYFGMQTIQNELDLMNGAEYAEYVREAYRNTTKTANRYMSDTANKEQDMLNARFKQDPYVLESVLMGYDDSGNYNPSRVRSMDWMDHVTRTGFLTDHQISIRGGGQKTNFLVSATYNKNKGVFKDEDYERYSIRANLNHEINKYIKIGLQTQYSHSTFNRGSGLAGNWRVTPLGSLYEEDGSLTQMVGSDPQMWNPLLDLQKGAIDKPLKTTRYLGSYFLEIKLPIEGLKFRSNLGIDSRTVQDYQFNSGHSTARQNGTSSASNAMQKYTMFTLENLLFYDKQFNDKHSLGITFLQSIQEDKSETNSASVEDLPSDILKYYDLGSALTIKGVGSGFSKWNMASFMGRINYSFLGKYLLTVSARYDGSSRLAEGHKWVLFPSAALAWRISDEKWLKDKPGIDNLKLRIGYGKTGNSAVSPYQTKGSLSIIKYPFDNGATEMIGYAPNLMANNLLTWETTDQWNLGIDFGFLKNRITGTLDLYLQNTSDLLLNRQLPVVSGFPQVLSNVGKTRNKGLELLVTTQNIIRKDFNWNTDWMFYHNHEEIVSLYNGKQDDKGSGWFIGEPINVHYDYHKIGIWQNTPEDLAEMEKFNANGSNFVPGSIRIEDLNEDYKITDEDKKILGTPRPKLIASMVNNFQYKGFDLSVFLYASFGSMIYNNVNILEQSGRNNTVKVDYWTPQNPTNAYPRPSVDFERPPYVSSLYYEKASYLRIRTITLGYTFPKALTQHLLAKKIRLYLTAQNPFIFTNYSGIDPEGASGNTTPSVSSWMVGINLSL